MENFDLKKIKKQKMNEKTVSINIIYTSLVSPSALIFNFAFRCRTFRHLPVVQRLILTPLQYAMRWN